MLTQEKLKSVLFYDPESGVFHWIESRGSKSAGSIAGTPEKGYTRIKIDRVFYYVHRLAWLYVYGTHPPDNLDHINRDRNDNRISNLRIASLSENAQNYSVPKSNKSGILGVNWHKASQKWTAQISLGGEKIYLGVYETIEEARSARILAKKKYHTFSPVDPG